MRFMGLMFAALATWATSADASQIPDRVMLDSILGASLILEDFESYDIVDANAEFLYCPIPIQCTTLDDTTIANGQGPGLVEPGAIYSVSSVFQWAGDEYFFLDSKTISGERSGTLEITYTKSVTAMGVHLRGFLGFPWNGTVDVYDTNNVLVGSTAVAIISGGPENVFFGWQHDPGIGSVVISSPDYPWTPVIDNHGYGDADLTIFVDDDAPVGGDGVSWDTAYKFLQDALAHALAGTEIRIAQGTYRPDQDEFGTVTPGDRAATFQVTDGVSVLGGFAGIGNADQDERNIGLFPTVLSGDLLADDGPDFANYEDNSAHVVSVNDADVDLDGLTISGGNAVPGFDTFGGGLSAENSTITVMSCMFVGNSADASGGGMISRDGCVTVMNCSFVNNRAAASGGSSFGGGGAMLFDSDALIVGCEFLNNAANLAGALGAASFDKNFEHITIRDCLMRDNSGTGGGAIYNQDVVATLLNCVLTGNQAAIAGGGLLNQLYALTTMIDCVVTDNSAQEQGGGVSAFAFGTVTAINCTISHNSAGVSGGGVGTGGFGGQAHVRNSVLWGNTAAGVADEAAQIDLRVDDVELMHSCVQGLTGALGGIGNIGADPLFVDPDNGDFRLLSGSPCIDAGHNWAIAGLADTDVDSNPRFAADKNDFDAGCGVPVVVDMGAYEFQGDTFNVKLGDIDGDGIVGIVDFLALLVEWGPCIEECCLADLDIDGDVGITDFLLLLANWTA